MLMRTGQDHGGWRAAYVAWVHRLYFPIVRCSIALAFANHGLGSAFARLNCDARTRGYVARRTSEGLSKREIRRCLKCYIAREVFQARCSLGPLT
jgi:hypothetical protein